MIERREFLRAGLLGGASLGILGAASAPASAQAIEQLQGVFGYRNAFVFPNRVFVPGVGDGLDADGAPKDSATRGMIAAQVRDFVVFARQLAPLRPGQA